jgi:RNA-binding protein
MTPSSLTGKQKSHLRALAHSLKPVMHIGKEEVTPKLVDETLRQLLVHELIKVKALDGDSREELFAELCNQTGASLVQTIGKIAVLYKQRAEKPKIVLPRAKNPIESANS